MSKKGMLRLTGIIILLVLLWSIAGLLGCSPAPAPTPTSTTSPAPSPTPTPTQSPAPSPTPAPTTSPTPSPTPTPTAGTPVSIDLSAANISFDKSTITVPAGARVIINFNNEESLPHNFALYDTPAAANSIFVGEVISGPRTITYEFTAPSEPGTYFFRCDVHPTLMTGDFIVE